MLKAMIAIATTFAALAPASAATLVFEGSYQHQNPPAAAEGRCGPALTVTFGAAIAPAAGLSGLGAFDPSGSHCIVPPLPTDYTNGQFSFDFGDGDILVGTYSGRLSATGSPAQFSNLQSYLVTGGTGRFAAATGSFTGNGLVTFATGQLPRSEQQHVGRIFTAAVPEPGTWGMLVGGFALTGVALRAGRRPGSAALG